MEKAGAGAGAGAEQSGELVKRLQMENVRLLLENQALQINHEIMQRQHEAIERLERLLKLHEQHSLHQEELLVLKGEITELEAQKLEAEKAHSRACTPAGAE